MITFGQEVILKVIGALALAIFSYVIGKRVIVTHKAGGWNIGKTLIVLSWFLKWGIPVLFSVLSIGKSPQPEMAWAWLGCFLLGHYIVRPIGKLLIA